MIRFITSLAFSMLSSTILAAEFDIVSNNVCNLESGKLKSCKAFSVTQDVSSLYPSYVSLVTGFNVSVGNQCATAYDIKIKIKDNAGAELSGFSIFSNRTYSYKINRSSSLTSLTYTLESPWGAIARYNPDCRISVTINHAKVDESALTEFASSQKSILTKELGLLTALYEKQKIIVDLSALSSTLNILSNALLGDIQASGDIRKELDFFCETRGICTFSDLLKNLVFDEASPLTLQERIKIQSLATKLDQLPTDCNSNSDCLEKYIDQESANFLKTMIPKIPDHVAAQGDLETYQTEVITLGNKIVGLKTDLANLGLDWDSL